MSQYYNPYTPFWIDTDTDVADSNIDIDHDAELETFFRVQKKMDDLPAFDGIPVRTEGRICKALDRLGTPPIFTFEVREYPSVKIDDKSVGWEARKPYRIELDLILAKSLSEGNVSCNGEQAMRRIVPGDSIKVDYYDWKLSYSMQETIAAMAFGYRTRSYMTCKIRNLCLYSPGSSLEWRREAPLSDNHRGIALVALNTEWSGGCLLLRRNGVEIRHPMSRQTVFFDIETEYAIEPVTDGNMVLLHHDVLVYDHASNPRVELGEDEEYPQDMRVQTKYECLFMQLKSSHDSNQTTVKDFQPRASCGDDHQKRMEYILRIVKNLLVNDYETVGLALHHHYSEQPILPDLLQQPDTWMYEAVTGCGFLDVSLRPILLHQQTDMDGRFAEAVAYPFDQPTSTDGDTEEDELVDVDIPQRAVLFVHTAAALCELDSEDYIENDRPGDERYFGCAMFLSLKDGVYDCTVHADPAPFS